MHFSTFVLPLLHLLPLVAGEAKTPGIYPLRPWTRTAPSGTKETVTPFIVEGITISPRPAVVTPTVAIPWISLKNNGAPATIKPKIKNGYTEKASPTYGTWFAEHTGLDTESSDTTASAEGGAAPKNANALKTVMNGRYYEGEFERLNPVIRCTPERYLEQGDIAPFCSPASNSELLSGHAYFVSWYSRYFNSTEVRINLLDYDTLSITSPSAIHDNSVEKNLKEFAFFTSEWVDNELGYYILEIDPKWIGKPFSKSVYIHIESTAEAADDLNVEHAPLVKFLKGPKAMRSSSQRYEEQTLEMAAAIPLCVLVFCVFLAAFHFCTRKSRKIGNIYIGGHRGGRSQRKRRHGRGYEKLEEGDTGDAEIKTVG
ncbi:hypothetical protein V1520DRAFT_333645 [Lipomyces starkeyi]|uniref:Peptidase A1 domain-containing protein n=1 Tax=Lipomyces starkeyi NRRL Y-11557 TaxID=675824 RepID=A0A1E3QEX1_LIPST|nr:hypothetical protein LIPSTDRAFT_68261 [Lipomyces starkeyi NRRL Y-11557]